jgi:hypothetical protein
MLKVKKIENNAILMKLTKRRKKKILKNIKNRGTILEVSRKSFKK